MKPDLTLKRQAIDTHSLQSGEFEKRYHQMQEDAYHSCFGYSRKQLGRCIEQYLPPCGDGLKLLDVGCGTGYYASRARQRGFAVTGIDASKEMVRLAARNSPGGNIVIADVETLPFSNASFDVVLCIEVLRYLPDPGFCLREIARVLKPGGLCLATAMPLLNLNGYWLINRLVHFFQIGNLVRLKQFFVTSWNLRRLFQLAGFAKPVIHGVYLGPVNWIERVCPKALPMFLRRWERTDAVLADRWGLREFSNMFLVKAIRREWSHA